MEIQEETESVSTAEDTDNVILRGLSAVCTLSNLTATSVRPLSDLTSSGVSPPPKNTAPVGFKGGSEVRPPVGIFPTKNVRSSTVPNNSVNSPGTSSEKSDEPDRPNVIPFDLDNDQEDTNLTNQDDASSSPQRWDVADIVADMSPYPSSYLPRLHDVPLKASFPGLFCLHVILSASPIRLIGLSFQHNIVSSIVSAKFYFQSNMSLYLPSYLPYSDLPRTRHFYLPLHLPLSHLTDSHFIIHLINSLRTSNIPFFLLICLSICQFSLHKTRELYFPLFLLQPSRLSNIIPASIIYFPTMVSLPINSGIPAVTPSSLPNHLKPLFQCNKRFWIVTHHQPRNPANPFFYGVDVSCPLCEERLCCTVCFCCTVRSPHTRKKPSVHAGTRNIFLPSPINLVIMTSATVIDLALICVLCWYPPFLGLLMMIVSFPLMLILLLMIYSPVIRILHLVFWIIFFPPTLPRLVS
jgi:hypothetical protein